MVIPRFHPFLNGRKSGNIFSGKFLETDHTGGRFLIGHDWDLLDGCTQLPAELGVDREIRRQAANQRSQLRVKIHFNLNDFGRLIRFVFGQELFPFRLLVLCDQKFGLDGGSHVRELRQHIPQGIHRIAVIIGKLIKRGQGRIGRDNIHVLLLRVKKKLLAPHICQITIQGRVVIHLLANVIDVFQTGLAIDP